MNSELSNEEIAILRTMWELKALGARTVTLHELASRLSSPLETDIATLLDRLVARELVIRKATRSYLVSLSPLGAAFIRQVQDLQLRDLAGAT